MAALRALSTDQAARGLPATLTAVVTFVNATPLLFVQDATGGTYIDRDDATAPAVMAGDRVEIRGITASGLYAPVVRGHVTAILGHAALPHPLHVTPGEIGSAWLDCQYAEVTATVRGVRHWPGVGVYMILAHGSDRVRVLVADDDHAGWTRRLIDAEVRVQGVVASMFNKRAQRTGAFIAVQHPGGIEVVTAAAADPCELSVRPIGRLKKWNPSERAPHRIRVQGTMTLQRGHTVYLSDSSGSARVELADDLVLMPGDRIDVAGMEPGETAPQLVMALARSMGRGEPRPATHISVAGALSGTYEAALVTIAGTVIGRLPGERETIVLQADGQVFRASFGEALGADSPEAGTQVMVTGICRAAPLVEEKAPEGFDILVDRASSLQIVQRPSWWTPARQQTAMAALAVLVLAAIAWGGMLRRQVQRKTSALRERLAEQRRAEAELRDSEARYRQLFESLPEPAWVHDLETLRFLEVNAAAVRSYGYSRDEFLAMGLFEVRPPEEVPRLLAELKVANAKPQGWHRAEGLKHRRRDGSVIAVNVASHLLTWAGRPARMVLAIDTSRQHRIEADLTRARDAAEAMSRAKGQFLANMSHEIRTPMNGILGMTELALASDLSDEQRQYIELAHASAEALLTVINDILDFSKVEAGRLDLSLAPTDVAAVVADALQVVAMTARSRGLTLASDVGANVPSHVLADAGRLRQVLVNLLGNAVKFTADGGVDLTVRAERPTEDGAPTPLTFAVRDTGIGIPRDQQGAIFDEFVQADGSTSRKYGGTGLGLAIAKRLVELMGGRITVESTPGAGSTFRFTIPVAVTHVAPAASTFAADAASADKPAAPVAPGLRVLVADDNPVNQRLLTALLERQGHSVVVVADGREAAVVSARGQLDLVLMDLQMPGFDGETATRAIRAAERGRPQAGRVPIVGVTADAVEVVRRRCLDAGMDDVLGKPVSASELTRVLGWATSRRAA